MAEQRVVGDISIEEVECLAFRFAKQRLAFDEPIPDFSTRFPNILESCVAVPFQRVYGQALYPSLVAKAAILFYLIIKNHPFQNGNKRIAITTLLMLLQKHDKWLMVDSKSLYDFTIWVAQSKAKEKDFVLMAAEQFIRKHLVNFDDLK